MLRNIAHRWGFEKTTSGLAVLLLLRSVARADACAMDPPSSQFLLVHPSNLHSFQLTVTLRACSEEKSTTVRNLKEFLLEYIAFIYKLDRLLTR